MSDHEDTMMGTAEENAAVEEQEEHMLLPDKIIILPRAAPDGSAATFQIKYEDHTLGNSLRYMIMKNPSVEFCGYSIPHPSEPKMNVRIQTYGDITAVEALKQGLKDLVDVCDHVENVFREKVAEGNYSTEE